MREHRYITNMESERTMTTQKESNIKQHSVTEISMHGLKHGGVHTVSVKNHGKSRYLFSMARELRENSRVLIFDGSETWLYAFDGIPVFTVKERDITAQQIKTIEEIERYKIKNWEHVQLALKTYKHILFRLKTRKPSKRGFFVRTVVNYLDKIQRESRQHTEDNEANGYIAYFIEEAQDCFNSRSTTRLEAEEFLSVFNEARNQKEAFFTASQRLTDFSKTIRTKQVYCIGKIPEEDKSITIRRLEKKNDIDFSKLEPRTWLFEGKLSKSPEWKQKGKPFQINKQVKEKYKASLPEPEHKNLWQKFKDSFKIDTYETFEQQQDRYNKEDLEEDSEEEGSYPVFDEDFI